MKKFKISMLAVAALVIGLVASSFTIPQSSKKTLTDEWFIYKGTGSMTDPSRYDYQGSDPGCPNTNVLCAVKVQNDSGVPNQDALDALSSSTSGFSHTVIGQVEFRDQ
jgi:hypothetical protein